MIYNKVKKFYTLGLYTIREVDQFMRKGRLTQQEYEQIIGGTDTES